MKLMTKEIAKRFAQVGGQDNNANPIVIAKYFAPVGAATWLATEYNPKDKIFFGYVKGLIAGCPECDEFGSFSLTELESVKLPFGLKIERDLFFIEEPISELVPALKYLKDIQVEQEMKEKVQKEKGPEIKR